MRKQLPTDDIANELAGSSVFFQPALAEPRQGQPAVGGHGDGNETRHTTVRVYAL